MVHSKYQLSDLIEVVDHPIDLSLDLSIRSYTKRVEFLLDLYVSGTENFDLWSKQYSQKEITQDLNVLVGRAATYFNAVNSFRLALELGEKNEVLTQKPEDIFYLIEKFKHTQEIWEEKFSKFFPRKEIEEFDSFDEVVKDSIINYPSPPLAILDYSLTDFAEEDIFKESISHLDDPNKTMFG